MISLSVLSIALGGLMLLRITPMLASKPRDKGVAVVSKFMRRDLVLKEVGEFRVPGAVITELVSADKRYYFNVDKETGDVVYADFGGIKMRRFKNEGIGRDAAERIALRYAARHRNEFKDFKLLPEQADYFWPKPTYWTFIWQGEPGSRYQFAKVTVDNITGEVAAFGVGSLGWSSFCLPDKKQATWATQQI